MELRDIIANICKGLIKPTFVSGKVTSVDKTECTCEIQPNNGRATMFDVRLRALADGTSTGNVLYPAVGSHVLVGIIENNENAAFIAIYSDIDEYHINGNNNGGLAKAIEIEAEYNKTKDVLDTILSVLNGTQIPEPGNSAPSALQAALKGAIAGKSTGDFSNIQNSKVKHGE